MTDENKKREAAEQPEEAPEVKKPKLEAIKTQIEYYLSDDNLKYDQFFHRIISNSVDGWIDLEHLMNCNKIRALECSTEDVMMALGNSELEIDTAKNTVRRKEAAVLPALQERRFVPKKEKRAERLQNDQATGVLAIVRNVPEKVREIDVKKAIGQALVNSGKLESEPKKLAWIFKKHNSEKEFALAFDASAVLTPQVLGELEFKIDTHDLKVEILEGAELQAVVNRLPPHLAKKRRDLLARSQSSKTSQYKFDTPVKFGGQEFASEDLLRKKVKEILLSRSNGEELKEGSGDFLLMMDLIKYHPDPKKTDGVKGIKVDTWKENSNNTCFHVVKEDGTTDNISMNKCYEVLVEAELKKKREKAEVTTKKEKVVTEEAETMTAQANTEEVQTQTEKVLPKTEDAGTTTEKVLPKTEDAGTTTEEVLPKTEDAGTTTEGVEVKTEVKTEDAGTSTA